LYLFASLYYLFVVCCCSVGLAGEYQQYTGDVYRYCRKLLALPFIPGHDVPSVFRHLSAKATSPALLAITDYVNTTWVASELWPPNSWSCYRRSIRTNNDVEAWHARLSRRTGAGNLGVYQLAERLHDESKLVALSMTCMSDRAVVRYQRASTLRVNAALDKLYDEYDAGTRSARKLLRACAHVYSRSLQHH